MRQVEKSWETHNFASAMKNSIFSHANDRILAQDGDKLKFNGFWRNGDKQNVCAWLDRATWHDAKTGEGGGCKEFAKIAFGMNLPDFMERFNDQPSSTKVDIAKIFDLKRDEILVKPHSVNLLWEKLRERDKYRMDKAAEWLVSERGILNPRSLISSGFANLYPEDIELFDKQHHGLLNQRLAVGPNLIAPLRSTNSESVENLFFRAISFLDKQDKSRLLTGAGGFGDLNTGLRGFGYPHLAQDFPIIALCEGMADYFAAEYLLQENEKCLPIGASNADALLKWAHWFGQINYKGTIIIIYQLDSNKDGLPSTTEIGQKKAIEALKILRSSGVKSYPFRWTAYLKNTTTYPQGIKDLADSIQQEAIRKECGKGHLPEFFNICLTWRGDL